MHGGLSPELTNMDQILKISRPLEVPDQGKFSLTSGEFSNMFSQDFFAIFYGLTPTKMFKDGWRMKEESHMCSVLISYQSS
jgi:hypothetical protein